MDEYRRDVHSFFDYGSEGNEQGWRQIGARGPWPPSGKTRSRSPSSQVFPSSGRREALMSAIEYVISTTTSIPDDFFDLALFKASDFQSFVKKPNFFFKFSSVERQNHSSREFRIVRPPIIHFPSFRQAGPFVWTSDSFLFPVRYLVPCRAKSLGPPMVKKEDPLC